MDETKKYASFAIPRRGEGRAEETVRRESPGLVGAAINAYPEFAQIEFEFTVEKTNIDRPERLSVSVPKAVPIDHRASDPIREKFYAMRSLTSGNSFGRNDAGLFYKQAKFMEDFSDDYQGDARFSMYYPYYQHMGYEQLRTYFTWRTKVRLGEFPKTSLSYVFLYIYELLSGVGVSDPAEGLDQLMKVWQAYREAYRSLNQYLPQWLKDYHIYYELPKGFGDFVIEHNVKGYYPGLFLFDVNAENSLALWNGVSSYDVTKSKFYSEENETLFRECFCAVLMGLRELCEGCGRALDDLLVNDTGRWVAFHPFQKALFYPWMSQSDRRVKLSGGEVYSCRDNRWTTKLSVFYSGRRELVGYVIKKTEACLRQSVKYKFKITANPKSFHPSLQRLKELGIPLSEFDGAIEKAVADYYRETTRTVVTVNMDNLNRIRKEAMGTQDKLTVLEEEALPVLTPILDETPPLIEEIEASSPLSDGWAALKEALNEVERSALMVALEGGDIQAFALENDVMPEVLADDINEKAVDHLGDNILELGETMTIYDEYRDKIAEMVG